MYVTSWREINFLQGKERHQCHGGTLKWNIGVRTHVVRSAFGSSAAHWGVDADCRGSERRRTTSTGEYLMRRTVGRTLNLILTDVKSAPCPLPMGWPRPSGWKLAIRGTTDLANKRRETPTKNRRCKSDNEVFISRHEERDTIQRGSTRERERERD